MAKDTGIDPYGEVRALLRELGIKEGNLNHQNLSFTDTGGSLSLADLMRFAFLRGVRAGAVSRDCFSAREAF